MNTATGNRTGALVDGRYRLRRRIADGGMASVYEALDERLDRTVAVKIIAEPRPGAPFSVAAFAQEAKTIARLSHPNVVAVYDQGAHEGLPYVVMEYVPGTTLRELLNRRRRLRIDEAVDVCAQILDGLQAAHDIGLVHRDIKPENILLKEGGRGDRVKVVDFGLAEAVRAGADARRDGPLLATAAYVAPELVRGDAAIQSGDVDSTAILLYELLTGEVPFDGPDPSKVAQRHVAEDVPSPRLVAPDVPEGLARLVMVAASRDPAKRPVDAGDFARRLRAADTAPRMAAGVPPRPTRPVQTTIVVDPERRARSWKALITLIAIVLSLMLVALAGWWIGIGRYTSAPSLLDQDRASVEAYASDRGFTVRFDDGAYSETVPKDGVLAQEPGVGERVRAGGSITVTLSLGPERYTMPDLSGSDEDAARAALSEFEAEIRIKREFSNDVAKGNVVSTAPESGAQVRAGAAVTLVISDGPPPVEVPDLVGLDRAAAESRLQAEQLELGRVSEQYSDGVEAGRIIRHTPGQGDFANFGDSVDVVVSAGPEPILVPDVTGKSLDEARKILEDAGFEVRTVNLVPGSSTVYSQSDAGKEKPKGSTIWVWA